MEYAKRSIGRPLKNALFLIGLPFVLSSCQQQKALPYWLCGSWKANFEDYSVTESWREEKDTLYGLTIWRGSNRNWKERLSLFENGKDELIYRVSVNNKITEFICKNHRRDTLVFENQQNDFPKRLNYVRTSGNFLNAWIDNDDNDPNRISFRFKKIR